MSVELWSSIGVIVGLVFGLPAFILGINKVLKELRHRPDHEELVARMADDKEEIMAHVTANRIQANRHTNKLVQGVYERMDETHGILLEMVAEVDAKVAARNRREKQAELPVNVQVHLEHQ